MGRSFMRKIPLLIGLFLIKPCDSSKFDTLRKLCPYTEFCTVKAMDVEASNSSVSCCANCSCDEDCWILDTCCPDVTHKQPVGVQKPNCVPMVVVNAYSTDYLVSAASYRVFDFCPRDYDINQHVIDQCNGRFNGTMKFTDIVVVSDAKHRIYKNKYCAQCHGVRDEDLVNWKITVGSCYAEFSFNSLLASNFVSPIMENCHVVFLPPSTMPYGGLPMMCGNNLLDYCEEAATLEQSYDCRHGPYIPYSRLTIAGRLLYKNPFCYLCSKYAAVTEEHDTTCYEDIYLVEKSGIKPLTMLIDVDFSARASTQPTTTTCTEFEIYDSVKRKCFRFFCPPTYIISEGKCLKLGILSIAVINIRVLAEPSEEVSVPDAMETPEKQGHGLQDMLLRKYGLHECNVIRFFVNVICEQSSKRLVYVSIDIDILFDEKCQLGDIANNVRNHLSYYTDIPIYIGSSIVYLTGRVSFYKETSDNRQISSNDTEQYEIRSLYWNAHAVNEFYLSSDFYLCPYFGLNLSEYNSIMTDLGGEGNHSHLTEISKLARVKNGFYMLSDDTIAVCVDTYFWLYGRNGGQSCMAISFILPIVVNAMLKLFSM